MAIARAKEKLRGKATQDFHQTAKGVASIA
jgi:hypothetical protein